jgi:hypothetical protein
MARILSSAWEGRWQRQELDFSLLGSLRQRLTPDELLLAFWSSISFKARGFMIIGTNEKALCGFAAF